MSRGAMAILGPLYRAMDDGVKDAALLFQKAVRDNLNLAASNLTNGFTPSQPGQPPARQTGALAKSITDKWVGTVEHPARIVGTNNVYARIHELGGMIRPKWRQYLLVPLNAEAQRLLRDTGYNILKATLRVLVTPKGLYLVKDLAPGDRVAKGTKRVKSAQTAILFKLVKSVYLPPRPYFKPAWEATANERKKILRDALLRGLKKIREGRR